MKRRMITVRVALSFGMLVALLGSTWSSDALALKICIKPKLPATQEFVHLDLRFNADGSAGTLIRKKYIKWDSPRETVLRGGGKFKIRAKDKNGVIQYVIPFSPAESVELHDVDRDTGIQEVGTVVLDEPWTDILLPVFAGAETFEVVRAEDNLTLLSVPLPDEAINGGKIEEFSLDAISNDKPPLPIGPTQPKAYVAKCPSFESWPNPPAPGCSTEKCIMAKWGVHVDTKRFAKSTIGAEMKNMALTSVDCAFQRMYHAPRNRLPRPVKMVVLLPIAEHKGLLSSGKYPCDEGGASSRDWVKGSESLSNGYSKPWRGGFVKPDSKVIYLCVPGNNQGSMETVFQYADGKNHGYSFDQIEALYATEIEPDRKKALVWGTTQAMFHETGHVTHNANGGLQGPKFKKYASYHRKWGPCISCYGGKIAKSDQPASPEALSKPQEDFAEWFRFFLENQKKVTQAANGTFNQGFGYKGWCSQKNPDKKGNYYCPIAGCVNNAALSKLTILKNDFNAISDKEYEEFTEELKNLGLDWDVCKDSTNLPKAPSMATANANEVSPDVAPPSAPTPPASPSGDGSNLGSNTSMSDKQQEKFDFAASMRCPVLGEWKIKSKRFEKVAVDEEACKKVPRPDIRDTIRVVCSYDKPEPPDYSCDMACYSGSPTAAMPSKFWQYMGFMPACSWALAYIHINGAWGYTDLNGLPSGIDDTTGDLQGNTIESYLPRSYWGSGGCNGGHDVADDDCEGHTCYSMSWAGPYSEILKGHVPASVIEPTSELDKLLFEEMFGKPAPPIQKVETTIYTECWNVKFELERITGGNTDETKAFYGENLCGDDKVSYYSRW